MLLEEYLKSGTAYVWKETFAIIKAKKIDSLAFSNIVDQHEITTILDESRIDKENVVEIMKGWKIITLDIVFPPNVVGVTAKIATALADANISIMPIAAYSRDHFLIQKESIDKAVTIFENLGIQMKRLV